jgi:threonine/homoserine/homoserine lactone efflux protein
VIRAGCAGSTLDAPLLDVAYLIFLGAQTVYGALRGRAGASDAAVAERSAGRLAPPVALRQGLVINLSNPKVAAFFPALLPQFAPAGEARFLAFLSLGLLFSSMTLAWLVG